MPKFFLSLLLSFYFAFAGGTQELNSEIIEIYFTQSISQKYKSEALLPYNSGGVLLKSRILQQIKDATISLDVALYNNSDDNVVSALQSAKNRGVRVRYIADEETNNNALNGSLNFPVLYTSTGDGIMHNKFIIADASISGVANMMISSTNFTNNGFNEDANNVLFIRDNDLASAFTIEFEEMWGSTGAMPGPNPKSGESKIDNTPHNFTIAGLPMELYFSPSDHTELRIDQLLQDAQHNIRFAIYTFTSDQLAARLIEKKNNGISVRGITDNNEGSFGKLEFMQQNGVDVLDHTPSNLLHHKYGIVDAEYTGSDPVVITGSHNWTYSADNINDEMTLIIHDADLAKLYTAEFNSRFCELAPWDCNLISTDVLASFEVQLFPSIAFDRIKIDIQIFESEFYSYSIFTAAGYPVLFKKITTNNTVIDGTEIDIRQLPSGPYFLQLSNAKKQIKTLKFIKL